MFYDASIVAAQIVVDSKAPDNTGQTSEPALSPRQIWTFTVVNSTWNDPPVVANGIAYVFNTEYYTKPSERYISMFGQPSHPLLTVYALNASDGSKLWEYAAKGYLQLFTVVNGTAYFSTTDLLNINGQYGGAYAYALNTSSGEEKWVYFVDGTISGTKYDHDNGALYVIFIASYSYDAFVTAVNSNDGKEIWRYNTGLYTYPRVAIGEGAMYFGAGDWFYALNTSNGRMIWNTTVGSSLDNVGPVLSDDVVYFTSRDGQRTYALNSQDGSQLWSHSGFSYSTSNKGISYVTEGDVIYAYEGLSGNNVWNYSVNETISSLEISNDMLFVGSHSTLTALNTDNGAKLWNFSLPSKWFIFADDYSIYNNNDSSYLVIREGTIFCYSGKTLYAKDIYSGKTLWNYTDPGLSLLTVTDGLAFYKTAHTIHALNIPFIAPSSTQNPNAQPLGSFVYAGLAFVALIVGITVASLIALLAKKEKQGLCSS